MEKLVPAFNTGLMELYPLFCGCEDCRAGHAYGPAVRGYFLIHCVRSGKGVFQSDGRTFELKAGDCFLILPHQTTVYRADEKEPWSYVWIAFDGTRAQSYVREAGLEETPVFSGEAVSGAFARLYGEICSGALDAYGNEPGMLSALYAVFAALPRSWPLRSQKDAYVAKVRNYVEKMVSSRVTVEELAEYCGLDRHYLCRVFKAETGLTLQEYVIGCKMRRARELLAVSTLSVGDVARSVGYDDSFNFSKMFKKRFGMPPARARKTR
jgi:AraC-like DNA-binding protein